MADAHEPQPRENGKTLLFRQSAPDCLSQRIEKLLGNGGYNVPTVDLTPDAFKAYGKIESGAFVPFWHNDETFDQFTQREAGINRPVADIVTDAAQKVFIESKIPISEQDRKKLPQLASLFTADEIDQLQGYALSIESEMAHGLALAFESMGKIEPRTVPKIVSPLPALREEADIEIIDFNAAVREAADAVYGSPNFYPDPETSPEIVQEMKDREIMPQEPDMIYIMQLNHTVYGSAIRGEAVNHADRSPVRDIGGSDSLVVIANEKNELLTSLLLEQRSFLRYLLGSRIIEIQRKRMDDLKYTFRTVREREMLESTPGEKWPFDMPAKRPTVEIQRQ